MLTKNSFAKVGIFVFLIILTIFFGVVVYGFWHGDLKFSKDGQVISPAPITTISDFKTADLKDIKKFSSEQEFKDFLANHTGGSGYYGIGGSARTMATMEMALPNAVPAGMGEIGKTVASDSSVSADRISKTNVQVTGIDEPDIVKTDGKELYLSVRQPMVRYYTTTPSVNMTEPAMDTMIRKGESVPPYYQALGETKLVMAFPPTDLKEDGKIENYGDLLLYENILVVFDNQNKIVAYDVTDKMSPKEKWSMELGKRSSLINARLMDGTIYLSVSDSVNYTKPCPLQPIILPEGEINVACGDIYYPTTVGDVDVTYTLLSVKAETGVVGDKVSFVGSSGQSVFYMSPNAAYLTYSYMGDLVNFTYDFFSENKDIIPQWMLTKIAQLSSYDLSQSSKLSELNVVINRFMNSLSDDDNLKIQNDLTNRLDEYYSKHRRDLEQTGIVKIDLNKMKISASGQVPGQLLNQFSMDEYDNHLRLATTVGENFWGIGSIGGSRKTVNDIYVLDDELKISGVLQDMGEEERIYAVRFMDDRGYMVTFRQTDPFFVLDLANPKKPLLRGELKIPGYSSYLHPLPNHKVLGLGQESGKVKISIFDVATAELPVEVSKYTLNEYWSEALNNHHAFLLDEKHSVFFIPGGQGGYVFSYADDKLTLLKAISGLQISRAVYLSDYLYLIGSDEIVVLDEKTWETVGKLSLK
ncbi:MAG: hypothetical protein COU29_00885 [Candidatus Magasanikbacteria bacterium CG10_big_fil_rev_8_21_14_0_10_36_32]|uniref:Beta propeller domain-containing protein n=1 Tax=Candidatus Magasanikbacteria bacterium CG10_big_fil_rev_8_21_14_0_10_36_32 TaxID=1974646 RepID=A0A2M6W6B3_9BACT|nr:MAG: hypothetical protein COU29_00885 [Candidatus Magasanikbacteria bacterium CG10_big_fil_rev_8_21_14_0_10_36_32]